MLFLSKEIMELMLDEIIEHEHNAASSTKKNYGVLNNG